jgi:hypothetical protein
MKPCQRFSLEKSKPRIADNKKAHLIEFKCAFFINMS